MLYDELKKRETRLKEALSLCSLKLTNSPEGGLRVSTNGNRVQYYQRKDLSNNNGTYIRQKNIDLARRLAEKEYYSHLEKNALSELSLVQKLLNLNPEGNLVSPHKALEIHKRAFITPFEIDDEAFIREWESQSYVQKSIADIECDFYTQKGEKVRSKSEIIIADRLAAWGIPYHYEELLVLNGGYEVYPDFTLLDVKKRRVIYLEHFGMMDNAEYVDGFMWKISHYAQNGIFLGQNLIATFEQSNKALSTKELDGLLKAVFEL